MNFQTYVDTGNCPLAIEHSDQLMMLGSCFAEEVGERLQQSMLNVCINPFGTLYNPASIASALHRLIDGTPYEAASLTHHAGMWHSMDHHSRFSSVDAGKALAAINASLKQGSEALRQARHLIVTFGTAYVFSHDGKVVANCHKMPAAEFERKRMDIDEITSQWLPLIDELRALNPNLQLTFTVSPVRHLADGAHGNQTSKATLLLAVDRIVAAREACHYFPSYEIVLDQLRDYRFFAADMAHPSTIAVDYVAERFMESCLTPQAQAAATRCRKVYARLLHRQLTDDNAAAERFRQATVAAAQSLIADLPHAKPIIDKLLKK